MPAIIEATTPEQRFVQACGRKSGPRVLTEGDSWFHLPLPERNLVDHLIRLLPEACWLRTEMSGDTAANMFSGESLANLRRLLTQYRFDVMLVSAGGNDLLDTPALTSMLGAHGLNVPAARAAVGQVILHYRALRKAVSDCQPGLRVVTHTYDYAIPGPRPIRILGWPVKGPWMWPAMKHLPATQRWPVACEIVDLLADALKAEDWLEVVDTRSVLDWRGWGDELHPNPPGALMLAEKLAPRISFAEPESRRAESSNPA